MTDASALGSAGSFTKMVDPYEAARIAAFDAEAEADRLYEWRICQERGHQGTGVAFSDSLHTWEVCRWCSTHYRTETLTTTVEKNAPKGWNE